MFLRTFKEQSTISRLADYLMMPLMYMLQGTLKEVPQRTHRWNNFKVRSNSDRFKILRDFYFIAFVGDKNATKRWFGIIPIFHMPIFGGWKRFVVLEPANHTEPWFVGWAANQEVIGISQIPIYGRVRVTIGPEEVSFFAMNSKHEPLLLKQVGKGFIGKAGEFSSVPIL